MQSRRLRTFYPCERSATIECRNNSSKNAKSITKRVNRVIIRCPSPLIMNDQRKDNKELSESDLFSTDMVEDISERKSGGSSGSELP